MDNMNAVSALRKVLTDLRVDFEQQKETEEQIDFLVTARNTDFLVYYNDKNSVYGFNMLQGGCKTYQSPLDFQKYFSLYIEVNTVFIPNVKIVSNLFEKEMGYTSIYDKFSGNKDGAFTAKFNVLDNEAYQFYIKNGEVDDDGNHYYLASLMEWNEDKTKIRPVVTYKYVVDDVQNCHLVPDINYFVDVIDGLYGSRSNNPISFDRIDNQKFRVNFDELTVEFGVLFTDTEIKYVVTKINDFETNEELDLRNDTDWEELKGACISILELLSSEQEEEVTEQNAEENSEQSTEEKFSDDEFDFEESVSDNAEIPAVTDEVAEENIEESSENSEEKVLDDSEFDFSDEDGGQESESTESNESNNSEESLEKDVEEVTTEDTVKSTDSDSTEEDSSSVETEDEKSNNSEEETTKEEEEEISSNSEVQPMTSENEAFDDVSAESNEESEEAEEDDREGGNETEENEESEEDVDEEDDKEGNGTEEREESIAMEVKLVLDGDKPVRVRFKDGKDLFDISYDKAVELKIPVKFITENTTLIKHKGMILTEEEVQLHVFAIDINDDENKIASCIEAYFA